MSISLATFLTFLTVAVLVSYGASRLRVPYVIAMVLAGLGVGLLQLRRGPLADFQLEPELILVSFLPGLLFEAAYHIDLRRLRENLNVILLLAIPGVVLSAALTGSLLTLELDLPLAEALLFGVLISATDPIAVVALFKQLGVDRRLSMILEGESLFNDGVAIVGFTILTGLAAGQSSLNVGGAILTFFFNVAGGVTLGLVVGFGTAELMKRSDAPLIDIALTTILAYGTFFLAEDVLTEQVLGFNVTVSPVIAVVVGAIVVGNYGTRGRRAATSTAMIVTFWEFMVFLINSAVFLLIGLDIELPVLLTYIWPIVLAIVTIIGVRMVVVYLLWYYLKLRQRAVPLSWAHAMVWGGMRGAVSVALALSIPFAVPSRSLLVMLTFGYVLFSVVVQGLTMQPLLRYLGLTRRSELQNEFEELVAKMVTTQASLTAVEDLVNEHLLSQPVARRLAGRLEQRIHGLQAGLNRLVSMDPSLADANRRLVEREVYDNQKQALMLALRRGAISDEVYEEHLSTINARLQGQPVSDAASDFSILLQELVDEEEDR